MSVPRAGSRSQRVFTFLSPSLPRASSVGMGRRGDFEKGTSYTLKIGVIQVELALEGAIRDTAQSLEHRDSLRQDLLECHRSPSTCLGAFRLAPPVTYLTKRREETPCMAAKDGWARMDGQGWMGKDGWARMAAQSEAV